MPILSCQDANPGPVPVQAPMYQVGCKRAPSTSAKI